MKTVTTGFLFATLMAFSITAAKAQSASQDVKYSEMVGENPNAEADIKTVSDYLNTLLVAGDVDKATAMLSANYMGYGPGPDDSVNLQTTTDDWKQNITRQQNRKVNFVAETFNVKSGDLSGHWVSTWGTYSFTQDGKDIKFPFQYTAHVTNGKIDQDRVYYDQMYILKTLGYTITPPSK